MDKPLSLSDLQLVTTTKPYLLNIKEFTSKHLGDVLILKPRKRGPITDEKVISLTFLDPNKGVKAAFVNLICYKITPYVSLRDLVLWGDNDSQGMYELFCSCYKSNEFKEAFNVGYDGYLRNTDDKYLCIIDILWVRPEYRCLGIGSFVQECIDDILLKTAGIEIACAALIPVPLEPKHDNFETTDVHCFEDYSWRRTEDEDMRIYMRNFAISNEYVPVKGEEDEDGQGYLFRAFEWHDRILYTRKVTYDACCENLFQEDNKIRKLTIEYCPGMTWEDWLSHPSFGWDWEVSDDEDCVYIMKRKYVYTISILGTDQPITGTEDAGYYDPEYVIDIM